MKSLCVILLLITTTSAGYGTVPQEYVSSLADIPQPYRSYPASPTADLHNKQFCVDVSAYEDVVWVEEEAEECHTNFVKKCEDKSEEVCADVTETRCEVIPYTECSMGLETQQFNETKLEPKIFTEKTCTQGKKTVAHEKLLPACHNVTKQNCVTLWETDAAGNQVWAGNDACEPVTWQECKLVPKDVQFIVPEITCSDQQELWYHEPEQQTETRMTNTFGCKVRAYLAHVKKTNYLYLFYLQALSTTECQVSTRQDCKDITYTECR